MADRWTSDQLLTEQGVRVYSSQIRDIFRGYADDFRALAREVRKDLVADPVPGDNAVTSRFHAWRVSRALREMARHAEDIVAAARRLERDYRRVCIELPAARAAKAARKELGRKAQASLPGGIVNKAAGAVSAQADDGPPRPTTPFEALFREAR